MLLTFDDKYLTRDGKLPERPVGDKQFLYGLCAGKTIYCSENTRATLPQSLIDISDGVTTEYYDHDAHNYINLGVSTYDILPRKLYIVRSNNIAVGGKPFRYRHKYTKNNTNVLDGTFCTQIEEWIRK